MKNWNIHKQTTNDTFYILGKLLSVRGRTSDGIGALNLVMESVSASNHL